MMSYNKWNELRAYCRGLEDGKRQGITISNSHIRIFTLLEMTCKSSYLVNSIFDRLGIDFNTASEIWDEAYHVASIRLGCNNIDALEVQLLATNLILFYLIQKSDVTHSEAFGREDMPSGIKG